MAKKFILYPFNYEGTLLHYTPYRQEEGDKRPTITEAIDNIRRYYRSDPNRMPSQSEIDSYIKYHYVEWRPQREFTSSVKVLDYHQGRSAFNLIVEVQEPQRWLAHVFACDVIPLIKAIVFEGGLTKPLDWKLSKRGSNYGISLVKNGS